MPAITYTVKVAGNTVSNVQEFTFSQGRQKVSDPLRAGSGTIIGRVPSSLPAIALSDEVEIKIQLRTGGYTQAFYFRVADFRVIYGFTAALDTWEIDIEDVYAVFGRAVIGTSWSAGSTTIAAMQAVGTNAGVTVTAATPAQSTVSAQVIINENALELLSALVVTEQSRFAVPGQISVDDLVVFGRGWQTELQTRDVSDDGTGTNPIKYDGLDFYGIADNFADKVIINPVGLAQQSAGVGNFSLELTSYNQTTGAAADLASYLLGVFDQQDDSPAVLTSKASLNSGVALDQMLKLLDSVNQAKIKFRGSTYYGIIEGYTVTGYPEDCLFTYYLSAPAFYPVFILDNTQFGVLDQNRLGY